MAGPFDFFTPGNPEEDASQPQAQNAFQGFLQDPRGRAALLQAGLSLMGGRTWGDNPTSQIARAVGGAGEAVRTSETEQRAAEEAQSKIAERSSRAGARGQAQDLREREQDRRDEDLARKKQNDAAKVEQFRSNLEFRTKQWDGRLAILQDQRATARDEVERKKIDDQIKQVQNDRRIDISAAKNKFIQDTYQSTLEQGRDVEAGRSQRAMVRSESDAVKEYNIEKRKTMERNASVMRRGPPEPIPDRETWIRQNYPHLRRGAGAPADTTTPAEPPPTGAGTPAQPRKATGAPPGTPTEQVPVNPETGRTFQPGEIRSGYRWRGGPFFDRNSWSPVGAGAGSDTTPDETDLEE